MITRTTRLTVLPPGEPIFSERATDVQIEAEAAGEFVEVIQDGRDYCTKIRISPEEWPDLRDAIDAMVDECRTVPTTGASQEG